MAVQRWTITLDMVGLKLTMVKIACPVEKVYSHRPGILTLSAAYHRLPGWANHVMGFSRCDAKTPNFNPQPRPHF